MTTEGALTVTNLRKSYGQGEAKVEVLKGINLNIIKGETLALTGKSGSGKSTLLSLLAGLDRPDTGEIALHGKVISGMSEKDLTHFRAAHMGIVFQQFHLVSTLTAFENVLLPLELLRRENAKGKGHFITRKCWSFSSCSSFTFSVIRRGESACGDCPCIGD